MKGILSDQISSASRVAANTQFKKYTSFTPFQLMFGRDCDPFGLLKLVTGSLEDILLTRQTDIDRERQTLDEYT